MKMNIHYVNKL